MSNAFVEAVLTRAANPQLVPTPPAPNAALLNNLLGLLNLTSSFDGAAVQLCALGNPTPGWRLLLESLETLEQLCLRPESSFAPVERWRAPHALLELLSELVRLGALLESSCSLANARESLRAAARSVECALLAILHTLRTPAFLKILKNDHYSNCV